jgi:hypothetical protein
MQDVQPPNLDPRLLGAVEGALEEGKRDLLIASVVGLILSAVGFAVLGFVVYFLLLYVLSNPRGKAEIPLPFPVFVVAKAIDTLRVLRWIRVEGPTLSLTGKGMEILRREGRRV